MFACVRAAAEAGKRREEQEKERGEVEGNFMYSTRPESTIVLFVLCAFCR